MPVPNRLTPRQAGEINTLVEAVNRAETELARLSFIGGDEDGTGFLSEVSKLREQLAAIDLMVFCFYRRLAQMWEANSPISADAFVVPRKPSIDDLL